MSAQKVKLFPVVLRVTMETTGTTRLHECRLCPQCTILVELFNLLTHTRLDYISLAEQMLVWTSNNLPTIGPKLSTRPPDSKPTMSNCSRKEGRRFVISFSLCSKLTLLPKILAKTWPVFAFMVTHRTAPFNQQLCMNPGKWRLR